MVMSIQGKSAFPVGAWSPQKLQNKPQHVRHLKKLGATRTMYGPSVGSQNFTAR
jgi:hypothetical protein